MKSIPQLLIIWIKKIEIYFKDYYFEEPRVDEDTARKNNLSESSFYVKVLLINKATGSKKEQEIYFGDIPILTSKGTFIINGIFRKSIISQLIRSAGVFSYLIISVKLENILVPSLFQLKALGLNLILIYQELLG